MHEALLFTTSTGRYWICQTYPIQFKGFDNEDDAIKEIKKKWAINKDAKFVDNCQHFCDKIKDKIYSTKCPHL